MSADQRVEPIDRNRDAVECAELMLTSEPWLTLRLSRELALAVLTDPLNFLEACLCDAAIVLEGGDGTN